jgi:hypothetical protein
MGDAVSSKKPIIEQSHPKRSKHPILTINVFDSMHMGGLEILSIGHYGLLCYLKPVSSYVQSSLGPALLFIVTTSLCQDWVLQTSTWASLMMDRKNEWP